MLDYHLYSSKWCHLSQFTRTTFLGTMHLSEPKRVIVKSTSSGESIDEVP